MEITGIDVYRVLKDKLGENEAQILVKYVESSIEKRAATKEDLIAMEAKLDRRIDTLEWKLRLYFIILGILIVGTNPRILEILGQLFRLF